MNRIILHCDMNNFYATVECMLNPQLKGHPVAVCGAIEERHGIVLAKNYEAKAFQVGTGDTIWQAKNKCPDLIIVSPPNFPEYEKYSRLARQVYRRFTDYVEPYGLDECWLDITNAAKNYIEAEKIADEIREIIKFELGLTISVGVSFNKIFAKLGSDMKKPDATTVITENNFRAKVWQQPVENLLGVGRATKKVLDRYKIKTIGDLANQQDDRMQFILGKNGVQILNFARGIDYSPVARYDERDEIKSVGHGTTTVKDLENDDEVWKVILGLTEEISLKLRHNKKRAKGISIQIRDNRLVTRQWQKSFEMSEQSYLRLAEAAFSLFKEVYNWDNPIRTITVQAIKLIDDDTMEQKLLLSDVDNMEKIEKIEKCIEGLNNRFGDGSVKNATLLDDKVTPRLKYKTHMPTGIPKKGR